MRGTRPTFGRRWLVASAAGGALAAYLLDPRMGRTRRAMLKDRTAGTVRRVGRRTERAKRRLDARASGAMAGAGHREAPKELDDRTLVDKIRSEVLGRPGIPKGDVLVDVTDGVVRLRGRVTDRAVIEAAETAVRDTPGVRDVENLLHTGSDAPNKREALRSSRRARG